MEERDDFKRALDDLKESLRTEAPVGAGGIGLKVEPIDISSWSEFPEDFFERGESHSTIYEWHENVGIYPTVDFMPRFEPCMYLSAVSTSKEEAITDLRVALLRVALDDRVQIHAYLAKPSTIQIVRPLKNGETWTKGSPSCILSTFGLQGPEPAKTGWCAFCFFHGSIYTPISVENLNALLGVGTPSAVGKAKAMTEGQVAEF